MEGGESVEQLGELIGATVDGDGPGFEGEFDTQGAVRGNRGRWHGETPPITDWCDFEKFGCGGWFGFGVVDS